MSPALELGLVDVDRALKTFQVLQREIERRLRQLNIDKQPGSSDK